MRRHPQRARRKGNASFLKEKAASGRKESKLVLGNVILGQTVATKGQPEKKGTLFI